MNAEQERIEVHRAAVMAWAARIPSVLASPDAARVLAFKVVRHLLETFARPRAGEILASKMNAVRRLFAWATDPADEAPELVDVRAAADHLGSVLYPRKAPEWAWADRVPYEVCEALRRACEDGALLCRGSWSGARCKSCHGAGRWGVMGEEPCTDCNGEGLDLQTLTMVVAPLLALLLHDAHALLTDLRADTAGLEALVQEAERRERAQPTARPVRHTNEARPRWSRESEER